MDFRVSSGFFSHPKYFENIRANCGKKEKVWANNDINDVNPDELDYFFNYPIYIDYPKASVYFEEPSNPKL